jgi:hypothetical protein
MKREQLTADLAPLGARVASEYLGTVVVAGAAGLGASLEPLLSRHGLRAIDSGRHYGDDSVVYTFVNDEEARRMGLGGAA